MKQLRLFIILQDKQKWRCSSLPPAPSTLCRWFLLETAYFWRFPDFLHVRPAKFKSRGLEATAYVILQALPHMGWSNQAIWKWRMFMSSWHVVCEYLPSGDRAWMASMAWSTGLSEGSVLGLGVSISLSDSQKKTPLLIYLYFLSSIMEWRYVEVDPDSLCRRLWRLQLCLHLQGYGQVLLMSWPCYLAFPCQTPNRVKAPVPAGNGPQRPLWTGGCLGSCKSSELCCGLWLQGQRSPWYLTLTAVGIAWGLRFSLWCLPLLPVLFTGIWLILLPSLAVFSGHRPAK